MSYCLYAELNKIQYILQYVMQYSKITVMRIMKINTWNNGN